MAAAVICRLKSVHKQRIIHQIDTAIIILTQVMLASCYKSGRRLHFSQRSLSVEEYVENIRIPVRCNKRFQYPQDGRYARFNTRNFLLGVYECYKGLAKSHVNLSLEEAEVDLMYRLTERAAICLS